MKKLLAILLSVLMLCTMIPFATVSAYEVPTIVASPSKTEAEPGDEITVEVSLMGNPGVIGAFVEVEYDHDVFELIPFEEYDEEEDETFVYNVQRATGWSSSKVFFGPDGSCSMGFANGTASKNVTKELFFTATLKVKADAYSGETTLRVVHDNGNFANVDGEQVNFAAQDAVITINGAEPPACRHQYEYACSEACALCGEARTPEKEHSYSADCDVTCDVCETKREGAAAHEYMYECEQYCKNCGEKTNARAKHNLTHVEAKEATCAEPGNIEYWNCEYCNFCWDNPNATGWTLNMKTVMIYVEHTLPEDLPYCADAVCSTCNQLVEGLAHEPVDGRYCQPGECIYCGEFVDAVSDHETNAWPPCADGNCLYCGIELTGKCANDAAYACQDGNCMHCGKPVSGTGHEYFSDCDAICLICNEETREAAHNITHVAAKAATCSAMGNLEYWFCDVCGMAWLNAACTLNTNLRAVITPATGEHTYDDEFDTDCNHCDYIREALNPIAVLDYLGKSVCQDVNGLAFGFSANVDSILVEGNQFLGGTVIPFDNGKIYNLSYMGAILSNEADAELTMENVNDGTIKNIPALLLSDVNVEEDGAVEFAVRIVNIPDFGKDITISARPYFVYSTAAGTEIVVYGDVIASSYNAALK